MADNRSFLEIMMAAACKAGLNSLGVLESSFEVDHKADHSPVTRADTESDRIINDMLQAFGLPIVSEESPLPRHGTRMSWNRFFLVDPLDGTRGFVHGGQEFAVNIALMENNSPALGVIALPISGSVYYGGPAVPSHRIDAGLKAILETPQTTSHIALPAGLPDSVRDTIRVIASRHSLNAATSSWITGLKEHISGQSLSSQALVETVQAGSAAKFCILSDNKADVYPRFAPCMEWDTAAGVAILRGAGGEAYDAHSGQPLGYGDERWYSRPFVAVSSSGLNRGIPYDPQHIPQ